MPNKKKSAAVKRLNGNPGKRKIDAPLISAPGYPPVPAGLVGAAREEWDRVCAILDGEKRLRVHDGGLILTHAKLYGRLALCSDGIDQQGLVVGGQRGLVKNPLVQIERNYVILYLNSCSALGIAPGKRDVANVDTAGIDADGLLDAL